MGGAVSEQAATADTATATAAAAFKALGDERRLRVLQLLLHAPDTLCGCELSDVLGLPDYQVSRALSTLRAAGLVTDHGRTGTWVHYAPARGDSDLVDAVLTMVASLPVDPSDAARLTLRHQLRDEMGCVVGAQHPRVEQAFAAAGVPSPTQE